MISLDKILIEERELIKVLLEIFQLLGFKNKIFFIR